MLSYLVARWLAPLIKAGQVRFNYIIPSLIVTVIVSAIVYWLNKASKIGRQDIPKYDIINEVFLRLMSIEGVIVSGILLIVKERNDHFFKTIVTIALCLEITVVVVTFALQLRTKQNLKVIVCDMVLNMVCATLLSITYVVLMFIAYFTIVFILVIPLFIISLFFKRD